MNRHPKERHQKTTVDCQTPCHAAAVRPMSAPVRLVPLRLQWPEPPVRTVQHVAQEGRERHREPCEFLYILYLLRPLSHFHAAGAAGAAGRTPTLELLRPILYKIGLSGRGSNFVCRHTNGAFLTCDGSFFDQPDFENRAGFSARSARFDTSG